MTGWIVRILVFTALAVGFSGQPALAENPYPGWEQGGAYDRLYDPDAQVTVKGDFLGRQEVVPMPGMSPGLALLLMDKETGQEILVHLGPAPYVRTIAGAFRPGSKVKAKGVWAEADGRKFFMASKVRLDEFREFKLRMTKDGYPAWDYKGLWK